MSNPRRSSFITILVDLVVHWKVELLVALLIALLGVVRGWSQGWSAQAIPIHGSYTGVLPDGTLLTLIIPEVMNQSGFVKLIRFNFTTKQPTDTLIMELEPSQLNNDPKFGWLAAKLICPYSGANVGNLSAVEALGNELRASGDFVIFDRDGMAETIKLDRVGFRRDR